MTNSPETQNPMYTRKDFLSSTDPRWCAGCGCYSTFRQITDTFVKMNKPREEFAIISGIGCSSRLPYYSSTFGFHTIHGRATTVAMGLKIARPELTVWVIAGDGDLLSIGGNHFIHLIRRNPDIKIVLFNNQIYGLTKGQASPTTQQGKKTKTTPNGVAEAPMRPLAMALAAGATFAARVTDSDPEPMAEALNAAAAHKGVAFVEVMMNCVIFNDGAFGPITDKATRQDATIRLRHGQPIIFGKDKNKGIRLNHMEPEVVTIGENGITEKDLLVHDVASKTSALAYLLSQMDQPGVQPVPVGIFRSVNETILGDIIGNPKLQSDADFEKSVLQKGGWQST
jgi:2-oxoglutarate ferredoxin oxidoreductase subunit beta